MEVSSYGRLGGGTSTERAPIKPEALLNGYIGTQVAIALERLGTLHLLAAEGPIGIEAVHRHSGAERSRLEALLDAAVLLGYVERDGGLIALSGEGRRLYSLRGYLTVTVKGFGEVLGSMSELASGDAVYGRDVVRDDVQTAIGCAQNESFQTPVLDAAMNRVEFGEIADLGCGSGKRLIRAVRGGDGRRGLGIDISPDACALSHRNVRAAGLEDRITIVCADVVEMLADPRAAERFAGVDLVSCFFLMHHFFADPELRPRVLPALRAAFSGARHFLVADGFRLPGPDELEELPIFSLAFELFHTFIDVELSDRSRYEALFEAAGLEAIVAEPLGHPLEWVYLLAVEG